MKPTMRIAMLHSTIRGDEKLLMDGAQRLGVELVVVDIRSQLFNPATWSQNFDVVLERCISTTAGMYAIAFFEHLGIPVINNSRIAQICEDKFVTSLALQKAGVATIPFALAFTESEAKQEIQDL